MSITKSMVFGLLVALVVAFVIAVVWWAFGMPYQVSIDVFAFLAGFVALCVFIIEASRPEKKSRAGQSR